MSALTAALYGALLTYLGGWFLGFWVGNFALVLFLLGVHSMEAVLREAEDDLVRDAMG